MRFLLENWFVNLTSGIMGAIIYLAKNEIYFPVVVILCCGVIAIHNYTQGRFK